MTSSPLALRLADRFRAFMPVVVDVETGGFDPERDALLELAAVIIHMDESGRVYPGETVHAHVEPFPGAGLDPKSLAITRIDPTHPFRMALAERAALDHVFGPIRRAMRDYDCQRAILVGHNASFDLAVINAAVRRTSHKRCPFHPFSAFDTVSLAGLAYGQTVLSRALQAAGLEWDSSEAHSALYDAERTAQLFCTIVNRWKSLNDSEAGLSIVAPAETRPPTQTH